MQTTDRIYLIGMIVMLAVYIYFLYRMDKRSQNWDKQLLKGMHIAPVDFDERGRIDDKERPN